jgi:acetyltransferase EpsM
MRIAIIGQGGHSKVIQDIVQSNVGYQIVGYLDDKFKKVTIKDHVHIGPISSVYELIDQCNNIRFVIAIGNNKVRQSITQKLDLPVEYYATLIHKSAVISPSAKIGYGTVVMPHAIVNADTKIGHHTIINSCSVIEHDNTIGDFVHVSPNVTLAGDTKIEEGTHVGAGATVIPGVRIGSWSTIGAGATVINDLPANCTAVGVPARIKFNHVTEGV